jgi:hypothetical protein
MAKIIEKGLAKAGSVVLQPGFTTRFMVKSKKSTKESQKSAAGETHTQSKLSKGSSDG